MSATYSTNAGIGIPSLNDTDYVTAMAATLNLLDATTPLGWFACRPVSLPPTSLQVRIASGTMVSNNGAEISYAGATITLTANQTNYIYLDSTGTLVQNTSGFPGSVEILPIAQVTCGATTVSLPIVDKRRAFRASGTSLSGQFLPLAGGTVTGQLNLTGTGDNSGLAIAAATAPTSFDDGQFWHDSTQKSIRIYAGGLTQRVPGTVFSATASGTVANTVTETTVVGSGQGTVVIPANLLQAGKTIRVRVSGFVSTTGTPNLTLKVKLGTMILSTGAVATGSGLASAGFSIQADFTCRTAGASGTVFGQGLAFVSTTAEPMATAATSTLDTTGSLTVAVTAEWGTASASNTITASNLTVELLN